MDIDQPTHAPSPGCDETTGHQLTCAECCGQLPPAQATNFEVDDYVLHFCSTTCYHKWQTRAGNAAADPSQVD